MQEELVGTGVLTDGDKKWKVNYSFTITTNVIRKPGFPAVQGHSSALGAVSAIDGTLLPESYFQLTAQDGEILKVKNLGFGQWTILAPV